MALREGILNAIVHRDYAAFDGGLSVGLYDDRIEIWNAGKLPDGMTVADLKQPHPSLPPNPDIANAFYLRGYIERWGMGTRQIVARCIEAGLPEPEWHEAAGGGVTLTIRLHQAKTLVLNSRQKQLLKSMRAGATITPKEYISSAGNIAERTARTDLITLAEAGYLTRQGQGRAIIYVRTDKKP